MTFNAEKELAEIKTLRKLMLKKRFSKSRLDQFKSEILKLRKSNASLTDIRLFLKSKKVTVVNSTIHRFLKKNE